MRPDDPTFLTREDHRLPGVKRVLQVSAPAAGVEWSAKVPGGRQWRPLVGLATFTTSAAVAQRTLGAQIFLAELLVWQGNGGGTLAASGAAGVAYTAGPLSGQTAPANFIFQLGLPSLWLGPGFVLSSWTPNLQGGDQYSGITLYLEEAYADDTQLSEAHLEREQEERALAEHSRAILIGG